MKHRKRKFDLYRKNQKATIVDQAVIESHHSPSYYFIKMYARLVTIILLFVLTVVVCA